MKNQATYNGWANRETWAAKIWMDEAHEFIMDVIEGENRVRNFGMATQEENARFAREFAEYIEQFFHEMIKFDEMSAMQRDFMNVQGIDFSEIASAYIQDFVDAVDQEIFSTN